MTTREWLEIPLSRRQELKTKFTVIHTGTVVASGSQIISDGVSEEDLYKYFSLDNINKVMCWNETNESVAFQKLVSGELEQTPPVKTELITNEEKNEQSEETIGTSIAGRAIKKK